MLNVRVCNTASVGVCYALCFRLDSCSCWCAPAWPGTSLGSPASIMTEDPWLGVTSCGSPGSEMCHQQRRPAGASPPVGVFFPVCKQQTGWVDGCPSLRATGRLQEHYLHLIAGVQQSLTEILEAPQVSPALCPCLGRTAAYVPSSQHGQLGLSLSLSLTCVHVYVCAFTGPKAYPSYTPL